MAIVDTVTVNSTSYDIGADAENVAFSPSTTGGNLYHCADVQTALDVVDQMSIPTITYGTSDPSGGSNGDIYIKYEA